MWSWAPLEANREARRRNWGGDYTLEEKELGVENVVTGLKRRLVVDDEGQDEDEAEQDEEAAGGESTDKGMGPSLGLNDILRFTTTGTVL